VVTERSRNAGARKVIKSKKAKHSLAPTKWERTVAFFPFTTGHRLKRAVAGYRTGTSVIRCVTSAILCGPLPIAQRSLCLPQIAQRPTLLMTSAPKRRSKDRPSNLMHCGHLCCPLCYLRYPLWAPPNRAAIPMPTSNRAATHPPNDLRTPKGDQKIVPPIYALRAPLLSAVLPPLSSVGPSQSRSDPYASNRAAIPMPASNRAAIHPPNDLRTPKGDQKIVPPIYALRAPLLSSVLPPLSSVGPSQSRSDPYASNRAAIPMPTSNHAAIPIPTSNRAAIPIPTSNHAAIP
jgi:hypothetical protein